MHERAPQDESGVVVRVPSLVVRKDRTALLMGLPVELRGRNETLDAQASFADEIAQDWQVVRTGVNYVALGRVATED